MKQGTKIGIVVAALLAAGAVFYFTSGTKEQAAAVADETKTLWMCTGCNEAADLSAKAVQDIAKDSPGGAPPYACSKCKEKKLFRAMKCEKCGTVYATGAPDSTGVCPKCNPNYTPPPPPPDEEVAPTSDEEKPEGGEQAAPVRKRPKPKAA